MRTSPWPSSSFPRWTRCRRRRLHGRSWRCRTVYEPGQPLGDIDNARSGNDEGLALRRVDVASAHGGQSLEALPELQTLDVSPVAIPVDSAHVDRVDDDLRIE